MRPETISLSFEALTDFLEIVDLAIKNNRSPPMPVERGLMTALQINDAQTSVSQGHGVFNPEPLVIRAPMRKRLGHGVNPAPLLFLGGRGVNESDYATHLLVSGSDSFLVQADVLQEK